MSALSIQPTFPVFTDIDGQPLEAGYIFIGTANLNPITNPINVFFDAALTQPAVQPIRTISGYPSNAGTPARLYVNSDYSIQVQNKNGSVVYSSPTATERYSGVVIEIDASDVLYLPPFAGAVGTDQQEFNSRYVNVFDFMSALEIADVKARTSGFDVTLAIQTAVTYAVSEKAKLYFPAGTYLVTDTINLPIGSQLIGETGFQYTRGFGVDPKATTINFQPTTLKSLFVCSGTSHSNFRFHYSIEGFYLRGNSTDASGNSNYALELRGSIYARYENIGIEQFRTGILCDRTINNRFCNIYTTGKVQAVLYAGNNETTDVWTQCSFQQSPIGVETAGSSIGVRFSNCLFEQLDTYGVNLTSQTQNFMFANCYSEDVCFGGSATSAMFRVGFDGTPGLHGPTQLTIIGGLYAGRNAGPVGAFVTTDNINGVVISAVDFRRFTNGILTSANTLTNQIVLSGVVSQSISTVVSDITKVTGVYASQVFNSGLRNSQRSKLNILQCNDLRSGTGVGGTGDINMNVASVTMGASGGYVAPNSDGGQNLGLSNLRWDNIFAINGTIITSDANQKQDIVEISDVEKRVALRVKGLLKRYRFKDAFIQKGDSARYHFGAIAQEVEQAFADEGLDASRYGLFCSDTWYTVDGQWVKEVTADKKYVEKKYFANDVEVTFEDDAQIPEGVRVVETLHDTDEHTRLGLRYDELLVFVLASI